MPPLLVGAGGLLVAALVVADDEADVPGLRRAAPPAEQGRASLVQRPAHLLHRHLWVFPPEAGPYAPTRSPSRSGPGSGAASARRSACPRNASAPPPTCPAAGCARSSHAGTPPPAAAP